MLDYEETAANIKRECENYIRNHHCMPSAVGLSKEEYNTVKDRVLTMKYKGREVRIPINLSTKYMSKGKVN